MPVVLCFPEYSSLCPVHDQHGSSVPSMMYWVSGSRSSAVGTHPDVAAGMSGAIADIRLSAVVAQIGKGCDHRFVEAEAQRPFRGTRLTIDGIYQDAKIDDLFANEPDGMIHVMACF